MRSLISAVTVFFFLNGCAADSGRITEYLSGLPAPAGSAPRLATPIVAGLVLALPETELGKPTTPGTETLEKVAQRVVKEIQETSGMTVAKIFTPIILPGSGIHSLPFERVRTLARDGGLSTMIVVVATSVSAQRLRGYPIVEHQLFVTMNAALVAAAGGRILLTESGQDDYVMADILPYGGSISYPRLYYRNFTFAGPFTVIEGDPFKALGWETFKGAADQIGMKLRQRVNPAGAS